MYERFQGLRARAMAILTGTCLMAGLQVGAAGAATLTPTTGADQYAAGGGCSLREAIASTNTNTDNLGCTHTGTYGADTINLTLPSYALTVGAAGDDTDAGGDLDVGNSGGLTLAGPAGGTATINASGIAGGDRVLDVQSNTTLTIANLTLTGGNETGVNPGGGIKTDGTLLTINASTIAGNTTTANGGGTFGGPIVINNSTISGNTSGSYGGGINESGGVTLTNTTVSGNTDIGGGAALASQGGAVSFNSTTLSGNSSGIFYNTLPGSSMTLKNTILAGNGAPGSSQCLGTGTLTSAGNNLRGNTSCLFAAAAGDLAVTDPLLGPLTSNGGPTQTRALLPGSLALNHGAGCPSLDQRGTIRPQGSACDIGAFELEVPKCNGLFATIVGTTGNDRLFGTPGNDVIVGLDGKDKLFGLKGDDVICGGAGNDKLSGGPGKDKLFGEAGKDKLKGGPGKDKLSGGPGKDKLQQ